MKNRISLVVAFIFVAVWTTTVARSQGFVNSELVATDTSSGRGADAINDLELFENGLFWSVPNLLGGVEFSHQGAVGLMAERDQPFSSPYYVTEGDGPVGFAIRDDSFVYYTGSDGLHRRPIDSGPGEPDTLIGGGWNIDEPGALMNYNGRVYYAMGNSSGMSDPNFQKVYFSIEYFPAPGEGPLQASTQVAAGNLSSDPGVIKKMAVAYRWVSGGLEPFGVALTTGGYLLNFELDSFGIVAFLPARVLVKDVSDFAVRREQFPANGAQAAYQQDTVYATTGLNVCASGTPGAIIMVDPLLGGVTTAWTAPAGLRLTAVGADSDYLFVSSFSVTSGGGPFGGCQTVGTGTIRSKYRPAFPLVSGGNAPPDPNWGAIELAAGDNLRSDGQYLYFTSGQQIRRMPNNAPRIMLDIAAVGLEAVQAVQDFNNSVPLVTGKPVLVRGYATVLQNSAGLAHLPVGAALHAHVGGKELPGSPLYSENTPVIDSENELAALRPALERSFQFHLPPDWLTPGSLTLTLVVNPSLSAPENPDALGNNSASATLKVLQSGRPTLVFKPMSSTHPNYDPMASGSGFGDIISRALTLLPVDNFHIFFADGSVTKPVATLFGIKGRSFTMPDDKNWALIWMAVDHMFSSSPDGNPDTHWVGMFPTEDSPFNGIGGAPGVKLSDLVDNPPVDISIPSTPLDNTTVVRMSNHRGNSLNAWGTVVGGHTLAHELGHNYGRFHIRQSSSCGSQDPAGPYQAYPADPCTLGLVDYNNAAAPIGYDPISGSVILPYQAGDLMSYADSDWVSPFTWNALLAAIPAASGPAAELAAQKRGGGRPKINPQPLPPHEPVFVWEGLIHGDANAGILLPGFRLPMGTLDPVPVQASLDAAATLPGNSPYHLRLLGDPNAAPLDDRPVVLMGPGDGDPAAMIFVQAMPDLGAGTRVQLMSGATVLSEIVASPNPPALVLGIPQLDTNAQTLSLAWTASDADGDPLLFTTQFSSDGGTNWQSLAPNQADLGIVAPAQHLRGGSNCLLRVFASDGFNTTIATTDPFVLPSHSPEVILGGVVNGQSVAMGSSGMVTVFAYDAEDGSLPSAGLQWAVSGPTTLSGSGSSIPLASLSPGSYTVTAQATDSDGNTGFATLGFDVLPLTVPDAAQPVVDGSGADAGYSAAPALEFNPGSALPGARLIHTNGYLYGIFEGLPLSDAGATGASIQIAFDTTRSGDATPQNGDIAFTINENGIPREFRGDGTTLAADSLAYGVQAVISRRSGFWSAELAIPDTLLGGWNHNAGVALQFLNWQYATLPGGQVESLPGLDLIWPPDADMNAPSTWAPAIFGAAPATFSNLPPVAVASGPGTTTLDSEATLGLSGAGSFDPNGDPITYAWTQTAGPTVGLLGADGPAPTFVADPPGSPVTLSFQLVVNDGQTDSDPAVVNVTLLQGTTLPLTLGAPGITLNPTDGSASIHETWSGPAGSSVVIQASTDLFTWGDIATNATGPLQTFAAVDASAGLYPMRFYRAVGWQPPTATAAGSALQFDGASGLVTIADAPVLDAFPLTIMAWINTTQAAGAYPAIIAKYEGGRSHGYALALDTGRFTPWYYIDANNHVQELTGTQLDGRFVADGRWHHLAYVVGVTNAQTYIDGTLMNELEWIGAPGPVTTTMPLLFGKYNGGSGEPFAGQLDEVSLWNRALSETEVRAHMHHTLNGTEQNLIGYWQFDDGSGDAVTDASGQRNNGVLSGNALWEFSTAPIYP